MKHPLFVSALVTLCIASMARADQNHITVYNQDLGLVKQIRTVDIKKNALPLRFTDVAAKIIPTSVHLRCLSDNRAFRVLEQNFEYDLASSDKILQKMIDHPIDVVRDNGELVRGVLLNKQSSSLVLKTADGIKILPFNDKTTIHMRALPEGLMTRPTLIWQLAGVRGRPEKIEVSYLTTGMNWHAEYVGVLNEKADRINLDAWVSVNNHCGATFKDAHLKLVAGEVHRVQPKRPQRPMAMAERQAMASPADQGFQQRAFFEYHIYELPRPTTLKDNQIKQIALFNPVNVKSERKFFYNAMRDPKKVEVRVVFINKEKVGLGIPLPAGVFRIYQQDQDNLEFIGEDRIDHTPRNEKVKITVGKAFDLRGKRKIVRTKKVSNRSERTTVEITLRNNKEKDAVSIIVEEPLYYRHWEIENSTMEYTKKDAYNIEFHVSVKAGGKATLRYTLLYWW
ncbi:MAG: DUF4139 domain-containing protein [Deltaproteobacteria bacterium]|nr:DUF4139 domain-containing protein [Deltaproteobacteria bacterium]